MITSPTYDGVVSDVAAIASVVHAHGALLIVDEAHGAHFGFGGGFPQNAIALGRCGHSEPAQDASGIYTDGAFTAGWDA